MKDLRLGLATVAAAALLVAPVPASATVSVSYSQGTTTVTGDGAGDDVVAAYMDGDACPWAGCDEFGAEIGAGYTQLAAGTGCVLRENTSNVLCPDAGRFAGDLGAGNDSLTLDASLAYDTAVIHGGDGNDQLTGTWSSLPYADHDVLYGDAGTDTLKGYVGDDELHGGEGDDYLYGGDGVDALFGDGGSDWMNGGAGNDTIDGGAGDDHLAWVESTVTSASGSDPGSDTLIGGAGKDEMNYGAYGQSAPVSVILDDQANDGPAGENDNVRSDVEIVVGTNGDDTLIGNDGANVLFGAAGTDRIEARGGGDVIEGGSGDDTVDPGTGADVVHGDAAFCSNGYWGDCATGVDAIDTRDGERDEVDCGPLTDSVTADPVDIVLTDGPMACESVTRAAGPSPGPIGPAGPVVDVTPPRLVLPDTRLRMARGRVAIRVACRGEQDGCAGIVRLTTASKVRTARRTRLTLGVARFTAPSAAPVTVTVRVRAAVRHAVQRARRLRVRLTATVHDGAGNTSSRSRTLALTSVRTRR